MTWYDVWMFFGLVLAVIFAGLLMALIVTAFIVWMGNKKVGVPRPDSKEPPRQQSTPGPPPTLNHEAPLHPHVPTRTWLGRYI